jgi:hypothetical protein
MEALMSNERENDEQEIETTYSGEFGRRNRSTPGRTPGELGLDPEEVRGQSIAGPPERFEEEQSNDGRIERKSPAETPGVETLGTGGISMSGGRAGGERGNSGTSDDGAGGPEGESRGGPGQYKSTSRGDLGHGTVDDPHS